MIINCFLSTQYIYLRFVARPIVITQEFHLLDEHSGDTRRNKTSSDKFALAADSYI